jgi:ABC-type phosphate transport system substrate-binding protein
MRLFHASWLAAILLACALQAAGRDVALIANKDVDVKNLGVADLLKLCKGQTSKWPNGRLVTFMVRETNVPDMKVALQKLYSMTPEDFDVMVAGANHGRTDRPAIVVIDSDEALVKKVASTPGAMGLVDVYSITGAINVVKVGGKLPLEPGYLLHGN